MKLFGPYLASIGALLVLLLATLFGRGLYGLILSGLIFEASALICYLYVRRHKDVFPRSFSIPFIAICGLGGLAFIGAAFTS